MSLRKLTRDLAFIGAFSVGLFGPASYFYAPMPIVQAEAQMNAAAQPYQKQISEAIHVKNWSSAIDLCTKALALDDKSALRYRMSGALYCEQKDFGSITKTVG